MDRQIRETLECPCCFELMVQPMMFASCGHSFCNLCIRRFLQQQQMNNVKKHCPVCNSAQADGERNLVSCLALAHVIDLLRPGSTPPTSTATKPLDQISKLPTLVYHLMSDDKLDEALRGFGLPSGTGISRDRKIMLHREYTLQVNSLCDAGMFAVDLQELCKLVKGACAPKAAATPRNPFASTTTTTTTKTKSPAKFKREHKQLRTEQRKRWKAGSVADTWRAVFSDELNQPVYYNTETKECTTQRPAEREEQDEEEDNVVVVVINDE